MVGDTHLAQLKMVGDDIASKYSARKIDNLNALSLDKFETSGRKVPESLLRGSVRGERGGSSSCYINSEKRGNEFLSRNRKKDLRIRSLNTFDIAKKSTSPPRIRSLSSCNKANKSGISHRIRSLSDCDKANMRSPPTMKRNVDGGGVSSSTENFMRMSSPKTKLRKVNGESRTSGVTDRKSEDNGKKTIRKHLHVRAYKKLITKHAKAAGNYGDRCVKEKSPLQGPFMDLGADTSRDVKVGRDVGTTKEVLQDERELGVEAIESLEKGSESTKLLVYTPDAISQEHKTKFSGSKCGRMVRDLESDNLLESFREEIYNCDPREMNIESPSSMLEELGVGDGGVCNSEFLGTPDQQIAQENIFSLKDSTNTQTERNKCLVCKQPGQLICCCGKGCRRSYHLSCFNPLLRDVPPGSWLCNFCVKKKMDLGVYSVSDGIESVWDVDEGMQSGKRYFVKYKGLAHVHNRWISESELLHEAPSFISNFGKSGQKEVNKWRKEWTDPERLLQKRLVEALEVADEYTSVSVCESLNCCVEWFVKWKGLEYDQATWELENSLLLYSCDAPSLIKDYECRREQVNRSYDPSRVDKALQVKKNPFCKMSELPEECPVELDNDHLSSVNFLREFWYKSLNAVLIDGQERISKSILFVLSLQSHACRPSLIMTTSGSLQLWQADFFRLAPSVNVIVYQGDKDARKMIQNLEFYEERGRLMFQVLLADPKAVVEDLVDIACIGWESIIVDECQNPKTIRYLEQLNTLITDFKLLLFIGQPVDSLSEYRVLLSFLSTEGAMDNDLVGLLANCNDDSFALTKLKEKLARHIVFECKTDSSKFLEYWVPVPLSSVQLEQYCATLLSNATVLRSNLRSDVVGALHNILITVRKCCDHPYLVDGELRCLLTKGLEGADFLNAEVCASGKLYLLGKILQDMKDRGLRVVILFQSLGGSEKVSLGDMLDDFLQQRFGVHTYERIETGMVMAKKVAALKKFNNKETGRFFFLIEKRACLPSVKLRSVDAIILFNSDWNPLNDLRSLQKISVESLHNCIRVFRFYTSYTVEEKLLMLAKEDIILESSVESISRNITHLLLAWGTSYLFQKLDQLHSSASPTCISEPSFEKFCLNDVILEILTQLPGKTESETSRAVSCSILMKARLIGGTYSRNSVLMGETEDISLPDKDLPSFWFGLLAGRHPKWMYISGHSHKIRKRIQNANGVAIQAVEGDEVKGKRRKINNIVGRVTLPESSQEKGDATEEIHKSCMLEFEGGKQKLEDQRNLLLLLRPELSDLCDILGLPESVKGMAQEFLVYIMNNHDVSTNQATVLQALKISLCWLAASMSRHSLDHSGSLSLARKYLKFECAEQEAFSVFSKLQILKEKFSCQSDALENVSEQNILDNKSSPSKTVDDVRETSDMMTKETVATGNLILGVTNRFPIGFKSSEQQISQQDRFPIGETPDQLQLSNGSLKDNVFKSELDFVLEFFLRRSEDLIQKQRAEVSRLKKQMCKDRLKLEKMHELDLEFIHSIHIDETVRKGKIIVLTQEFSDKLSRFDQRCKQQKQKLKSMQLYMRNKEQELKDSWLEKAKTGKMDESLDDIPTLESRFRLEDFLEASEFTGNCNKSGATILNSACPSSETNTVSEGCLKVPSNILNEREENLRLEDDARAFSTSIIVDNLEHIMQNRVSVEPEVPHGLSEVLPIDSRISIPQSEVSNTLRISGSITAAAFNFKQQECRDDSNDLLLVPNPGLNQGELLSSVQGLASSLSSIQELCTNEHISPAEALTSGNDQNMDSAHEVTVPASDSVVSLSPNIEMISCNDVAPSNSTNFPLPLAEHEQERLPPARYQEETPQSHHSVELVEVPSEQEIMPVAIESESSNHQIPENAIHPSTPHGYLPSEGIPSEHHRSTISQEDVACDWSNSSSQLVEEVQDAIEAAVFESEPSIRQNPENNPQSMRPQEDLPLERTNSEHLRSADIQQVEPSQIFLNSEWVPAHAISTDPICNELYRVQRQDSSCTKKHENKKLQLLSECEQEMEKVRRKYDILLQNAEKEYLYEKTMFRKMYQKIIWHRFFAEEVRSKFLDHKEGSSTSFEAPSRNSSQHLQASQPQAQLVPLSTSSRPLSPSQAMNQAPFIPFLRPQGSVPSVIPIHPAGLSTHTSPVISINTVRGPINSRANSHFARSPAPHLQRGRLPHASDPTTNTLLNPHLAIPTLVSTATPSVPPPNFVSTFPAISNTGGIPQPSGYGPTPLYSSPTQFEDPQFAADDLLEALLANFPATNDEFCAGSTIDLRPNASPDVIYLTDED